MGKRVLTVQCGRLDVGFLYSKARLIQELRCCGSLGRGIGPGGWFLEGSLKR